MIYNRISRGRRDTGFQQRACAQSKITLFDWRLACIVMAEPLSEDSAMAFRLIKLAPGISGRHLMYETGFRHDRAIDTVKELVLKNMVRVDLSNYPDFQKCRFFPT
jgi:hypothetical protein